MNTIEVHFDLEQNMKSLRKGGGKKVTVQLCCSCCYVRIVGVPDAARTTHIERERERERDVVIRNVET
jgi:hypothetical protein